MTVALDEDVEDSNTDSDTHQAVALSRPAGWWQRAGALGIDVAAPLGVAITALLVGWSAPWRGWLWWLCLTVAALVVLAIAVNRLLAPVITGWSLGRSMFGIAVADRDGEPVGPWRLLLRDLAHLADTAPLLLGWLWPLLESRGRTFADMLVGTEVVQVDAPRPPWRRLAIRVLAVAAVLSVVGAALGYFAVYRQQRALAQTREQIEQDGPKIVTDMLTYTVKTADEDFARAQSLVTDGYRPELIAQQEAVRKAGMVDNDYWVSNSAVLSSAQDRAAMLLLLQGQRGAAPTQRFVTASVRAEYEKTDGQWKVSNLIVLTPPKSGAAPAPTPQPSPAPKPSAPAPKPGAPAAPKPPATPAKPAPKPTGAAPAAPKPPAAPAKPAPKPTGAAPAAPKPPAAPAKPPAAPAPAPAKPPAAPAPAKPTQGGR